MTPCLTGVRIGTPTLLRTATPNESGGRPGRSTRTTEDPALKVISRCQAGLAQQEIGGGVLRALVLPGPVTHEPRATSRGKGLVHTAGGPVPLMLPPSRFDP